MDMVNSTAKCSVIYKHIKFVFEREYYLTHLPFQLRLAMSRIRTCNHKLPIGAGRYVANCTNRENRKCTECNTGVVGDEFHFISP